MSVRSAFKLSLASARARQVKLESLILAQNERWRRALHMQVERGGVAIPQSSGERVSNAWITCPEVGDNPGKLGLIPHDTERSKGARKGFRHWRGPRPIS